LKIQFPLDRRLVAVIALGLAFPISAEAGILFFANRAAWQNAAGPSSFTENFSGFATNTPFQSSPVALNGMTIQQEGTERMEWNQVEVPPFQFTPNSGSNSGLLLTNYPEGGSTGIHVRITFAGPNKAFGLESWSANDGEGVILEVFNGATSLGTLSLTNADGAFAGYVLTGEDIATSVRLRSVVLVPGMVGERFYIDNLAGVAAAIAPVVVAPPVFAARPVSQAVAIGNTVVFNAPATDAGSYRWERNGAAIAGATSATLVINNVSVLHAGTYVALATNSGGTTSSAPAALTALDLTPPEIGRLVNLSILTSAGPGAKVLTMGAVVGGGDATSALPLVIRAVGPTLSQPPFNVPGVLPDPVMSFYASGNPTPIETNDNWGGSAAFGAAFRAAGAFDLPAASLDSAIVRTSPGATAGGYTVQVTGKGDSSGSVIAEIYDAAVAARTAATPRLTNLSTRGQIDAGANLTVGFVLSGKSARTMLVRGVGPSLAEFGIVGVMADPRLELFDNSTGQRVAGNDNWAGSVEIATTAASVGAFALVGGSSKDAVLLVTLPPGAYSARIDGIGGSAGIALVEVYEVP
jgi:hypothetical protein